MPTESMTARVSCASLSAGETTYPFWFDLWRTGGWSRRVARVWSKETAWREKDRSLLDVVLPTLAPEHQDYVARTLRIETRR